MRETRSDPGNIMTGFGKEQAEVPDTPPYPKPHQGEIAVLKEERTVLRREIHVLKQSEEERIRIEESLKETEERFKKILESTRDGIILNDSNGIILEWNSGMERIFGIPRENAVGRTITDMAILCLPEGIPDQEAKQWLWMMIGAMDKKTRSSSGYPFIEIPIRRPDGISRTFEARNFTFEARGTKFYGGIIRDITERKGVEESLIDRELELDRVIESSGDGIILTDEEGRIMRWNRGVEQITGLPASTVLGCPAWEIQSLYTSENLEGQDTREHYRSAWARLLHDETDQRLRSLFDGRIRTPDGSVKYIQQRVFPIPKKPGFRIGAIIRDITEQKKERSRDS